MAGIERELEKKQHVSALKCNSPVRVNVFNTREQKHFNHYIFLSYLLSCKGDDINRDSQHLPQSEYNVRACVLKLGGSTGTTDCREEMKVTRFTAIRSDQSLYRSGRNSHIRLAWKFQ